MDTYLLAVIAGLLFEQFYAREHRAIRDRLRRIRKGLLRLLRVG